jgi:hypothetical protein
LRSESLNSTPNPVATAFSMAGFAGSRRPQAPGGHTPIPGRLQVGPGGLLLFFRFAQDVAHTDEGYCLA